ncbi:GFA family protein [Halomonas sp. GXIMD04776]|uniref:GFA family protein n=1 Tax=Halomonas sp. GXIMD04776 TaxID=3415605 RepID=UPI003CAE80B9
MKGECLCGEVKFEIEGKIRNLYQCHCSLCRRATGAAANAATFVTAQRFRWVSGENEIRSFLKPTGFRSDFCSICGSPVPNRLRGTDMVWVPAGLLDELIESRVSAHLHITSAAPWEQESTGCVRLDGGPDSLESLNKLL